MVMVKSIFYLLKGDGMLWYSASSDQCEGFASRILRGGLKDVANVLRS